MAEEIVTYYQIEQGGYPGDYWEYVPVGDNEYPYTDYTLYTSLEEAQRICDEHNENHWIDEERKFREEEDRRRQTHDLHQEKLRLNGVVGAGKPHIPEPYQEKEYKRNYLHGDIFVGHWRPEPVTVKIIQGES